MIGMIGSNIHLRRPVALRRLADHPVGFIRAQQAYDIAAEFQRGLQFTIAVVQKNHILESQNFACGSLFLPARLADLLACCRADVGGFIGAAAPSFSTDDIIDIPALTYPFRHSSSGAELGV